MKTIFRKKSKKVYKNKVRQNKKKYSKKNKSMIKQNKNSKTMKNNKNKFIKRSKRVYKIKGGEGGICNFGEHVLNSVNNLLNPNENEINVPTDLNNDNLIETTVRLSENKNENNIVMSPEITVMLPEANNGIHIGDKIIKKISGPVSFYYLKPTKVKEPGIDYPLLMLFGDMHRSRDNMCDPCNSDKGCYQIYDDRFLQLLDKVSSLEKPMDIYFEDFKVNKSAENLSSFFSETHENPKLNINNIPPLENYQMLFFNCFNHIKRTDLRGFNKNINNKVCPTRTIRWQYADVRFCNNDCIEGKIMQYLKNYLKNDKYKQFTIFEDKFNELVKGLIGLNTYSISNFMDFSNKLFNNFLTIENKSIIRKQINKQQNSKLKDINFWIEIYATSLMNDFIKINPNPNRFYVYIPSTLVDIYTILRIMKTSDVTSIQPTICMIYLGNDHILNMVEIFTKQLDYSTDYNIEITNPINRCLEITKEINLSNDVDEHNKMRDLPL